MLTLVQGPAGGAKSQLVAGLIAADDVDIVSDVTRLWVALSGATRGPDGRYPVRLDGDPALHTARYVQAVAVRRALEDGARVAVTTSRAGEVARWQGVADDAGAAFAVRTVDPGEDVVRARLAEADGELSPECNKAIKRWYI